MEPHLHSTAMLRTTAAIALLVWAAPTTLAQSGNAPPQPDSDGVYSVVETPPALRGGLEGLQGRVVYPDDARQAGVEGRVFVTFVVAEDGSVVDPVVVRSPDERLSEAALASVRASEFAPGMVAGRAVPVRYSLPISFRLPGGTGETPAEPGFVSWDTEYSENVERHRDATASIELSSRAMVLAGVAYEGVAFEGLTPGTAEVRFTVSAEGTATGIEVVSATTPVVERFARFQVLTARFAPEAAGESATATVEVQRVGR